MKDLKTQFEDTTNQMELFKTILDVRKFEIELYWKRATYFWAFIAVIFAGFFAITASDVEEKIEIQFIFSCLGLVFSLAWYLVNRGSKFWQENWEAHAASLENQVVGPIFKTTLKHTETKKIYKDPFGRFSFSVSRINIILSLFVSIIWLFLVLRSINTYLQILEPFSGFNYLIIGGLTITCIVFLFSKGRTFKKNEPNIFIERTPLNQVEE